MVVLDDVHLLDIWDCLDAVTRLIDYLPEGSQLAIASRGEPFPPLARLRAEGRVVEVGPEDLAMDREEASSCSSSSASTRTRSTWTSWSGGGLAGGAAPGGSATAAATGAPTGRSP